MKLVEVRPSGFGWCVHSTGWSQRIPLAILFLLQNMAMAAWYVPLTPFLEAHGHGTLAPWAFATSALAALVTPLVFGALADRHLAAVVVLRWSAFSSAVLLLLAGESVVRAGSPGLVLMLVQLQALVAMPSWSLLTSIVLAGLVDPKREFGPVRAAGTVGWILGCLAVSAVGADASVGASRLAVAFWIGLALATYCVPSTAPAGGSGQLTLRQRLGLDALGLLKERHYRVLFVSAGLLSAPLAAFYPFTPALLRSMGLQHTSAWMSLAQVTEVVAMFGLAALLARWRLRTVLAAGLVFAFLRYVLLGTAAVAPVLVGVSLHGFAYTLFFVAAPIDLNERMSAEWRVRAQALLSLMTQGLGNLLGYLGTGAWLEFCRRGGQPRWDWFWGGLALAVGAVMTYFLVASRDQPGRR